jgi:hypothetical protein
MEEEKISSIPLPSYEPCLICGGKTKGLHFQVIIFSRFLNTGCIKNRKFGRFFHVCSTRNFFSKMTLLGLILCGEIDCVHFQCFSDPGSGDRSVY